jgi:ferredoxin-NADP reductase/MOSC domain-containing protein YiiM
MASLISVNVGKSRHIEWRGKTVTTAIWKKPVAGPVRVGRLGAEGDEQADLMGHGGEQRALFVYQIESYCYWQDFLKRDDFAMGQFGENLTVSGLPDDEVYVGDRYRIGDAVVEVSQPRVTCYKVGIRFKDERMPALLVQHRRPGFYFRVIREGTVEAGAQIEKIFEGPGKMSVSEVDALLYTSDHPPEKLDQALRIEALSPGWRWSFEELRKAAGKPDGANVGLSPLGATSPPAWQGFRKLKVTDKKRESEDVMSFSLTSEDGTTLPPALPGQYLTVKVRPNEDGAVETRSYSLCGPGGEYRIGVKRDGRVSTYLHDAVEQGSAVEAAAPRGAFVLGAEDEPVVLLSAGIGITPMLAMLRTASADQARAHPVWWVHAARDGRHHPFSAEVRYYLGRARNSRSFVFYSRPVPSDRRGADFDISGRLDLQLLKSAGMPLDGVFYLCGPPAFARAFKDDLAGMGVSADRIRTESFGPSAALPPGGVAPHLPEGEAGAGPMVRFMRSGLSVPWSRKYVSLLELAEACDVTVRWSCRTGVCHNCECAVVDGNLEYAIEPIDRPPEGRTLLCCAVPKADVVLEL